MKKAEGVTIIGGVLFCLMGVLGIVMGVLTGISENKFQESALTTTAIITDIDVRYYRSNGKNKKDRDVFVEYEVEGQKYRNELNIYKSSMREGQRIEVFYDPENPGDSRIASGGVSIIIVIMGIIFLTFGTGFIVLYIKNKMKRKNLLSNGICVTGTIIDVVPDMSVRINQQHPYKAEVEFIDSITGERYLYSSDSVMNKSIHSMVGATVNVYVNPQDKSSYYVDLESATANINNGMPRVYDYR